MKPVTVFPHLLALPTMAKGLSEAMYNDTIPSKLCPKCNKNKPLTTLFWHKQKDGFHTICKDCRNNDAKNRYTDSTYHIQYYQENKERLREMNRANYKKNQNRDAKKFRERQRLFRIASLPGDMTELDWQSALEYFNGRCAVCGQEMDDILGTRRTAIDHWIPIDSDECPGTVVTNIVPLCHGEDGCNNRKKAKAPDKFLSQYYSPEEAYQILDRIHGYFEWARKRKYGE